MSYITGHFGYVTRIKECLVSDSCSSGAYWTVSNPSATVCWEHHEALLPSLPLAAFLRNPCSTLFDSKSTE